MQTWSQRAAVGLFLMFAAGGWLIAYRAQPARAAAADTSATAHAPDYTVVSSDASSLIVTDNRAHTIYYYAIDDDEEFGAHLKLRGKVDLAQVGKGELVTELPGKK